MKREKRLRVKFTFTKDFDRTTKMSDAEIDKIRLELYRKTGWNPTWFHQRIVHAFVTPERTEDSEVGITGKINLPRK